MFNKDLYHYYAAHAPETIPDWFHHKRTEKPKNPIYPHKITSNVKVIKFIESWISDSCFNLSVEYELKLMLSEEFRSNELPSISEIEEYENEWLQYWEEEKQWRLKDQASRYFQWRKYYADVMANGLLLEAGLLGGIEALEKILKEMND